MKMKSIESLERYRKCGGKDREVLAKTMGRLVALAIILVGALVVAVGMSACHMDDDDDPDSDWYLSGVWADTEYPDEVMVFYGDGTGYWLSDSTGDYLDFDYYCYGDNLFFTFYPFGAPSYNINCYIVMNGARRMSITWPPSSMFGSVTIDYYKIR